MNNTSKHLKKTAAREDGKDLADRLALAEFQGKLSRLITAIEELAKKIDNFQTAAPVEAACDFPENDSSARTGRYWFLK